MSNAGKAHGRCAQLVREEGAYVVSIAESKKLRVLGVLKMEKCLCAGNGFLYVPFKCYKKEWAKSMFKITTKIHIYVQEENQICM